MEKITEGINPHRRLVFGAAAVTFAPRSWA